MCLSLFRHSNRGLITKGTIGSPVGKRPPFAKRVQNIWEVLRKQKRNNGRTPFAGVYKFVCVCGVVHKKIATLLGPMWTKQQQNNVFIGSSCNSIILTWLCYSDEFWEACISHMTRNTKGSTHQDSVIAICFGKEIGKLNSTWRQVNIFSLFSH